MASADDSIKRRRLLSDASPANYLDATSQLFFAVALSDHNAAAVAIRGDEWETLDFGDIEKDLAARLSDKDISAVLICTDAVNNLKTLKLTNCLGITGACLEPLRESTMIEQIDLSLVRKHQSPDLDPAPPISFDHVMPILDSIIEREGRSLRHLQFPSVWHEREDDQLDQFLQRYGEMLPDRGIISCYKCSCDLPPGNTDSWIDSHYGSQNYTCCECLRHYCEECRSEIDDGQELMISHCNLCERKLCLDCQKMKYCYHCESYYCVDCAEFTECSCWGDVTLCGECVRHSSKTCCKCERIFCECEPNYCSTKIDCCSSCKEYCCDDCQGEYGWVWCEGCQRDQSDYHYCEDCNEKKGTDAIRVCENCPFSFCGKCRVSWCQGEVRVCAECIQIAGPFLLEENKKVKAEIQSLKDQLQCHKVRIKELEEEKIKQISKSGDDE